MRAMCASQGGRRSKAPGPRPSFHSRRSRHSAGRFSAAVSSFRVMWKRIRSRPMVVFTSISRAWSPCAPEEAMPGSARGRSRPGLSEPDRDWGAPGRDAATFRAPATPGLERFRGPIAKRLSPTAYEVRRRLRARRCRTCASERGPARPWPPSVRSVARQPASG